MVWDCDLLPASDGEEAANLPMGDEVELNQCWIGEGLGMRVAIGNYQRSSLTRQIANMNYKEIGEILEVVAEYSSN
ncbi:hypothetical protein C7B80_26715 [Cyanosarcina cf. burmensis CCALA 770]|nr:hypothetical protein C7B80_26715 [Cyanosarcina cf. burmensis CCALA 770]